MGRHNAQEINNLMETDTIIFCEPHCWDFEHATFNAALLRTVQLAYPASAIRFFGEKGHLEQVRHALELYGNGNCNIFWEEYPIHRRNDAKWKRPVNDFSWCNSILIAAIRAKARLLVLCSINNTGLLLLKLLMYLYRFKIPTIAVPHSCLAALLSGQPWRPWSMRGALDFPHPDNLRLVALGGSIYQQVLRLRPGHESQWTMLDIPYLWPVRDQNGENADSNKVRFGFLGAAGIGKGFHLFCNLADKIVPYYPDAEFILVGFFWGFNSSSPNSKFVTGISDQPLSIDEFHRRASSLTYSVWLATPEHYRLTASATFLDSLAYLKPGIYLRNPYIEYYFDQMGDIGYLCDNYEHVISTIKSILMNFPHDRYNQQVKNILKGRRIFEPDFLAPKLRHNFE
jgi:hypothetical protein